MRTKQLSEFEGRNEFVRSAETRASRSSFRFTVCLYRSLGDARADLTCASTWDSIRDTISERNERRILGGDTYVSVIGKVLGRHSLNTRRTFESSIHRSENQSQSWSRLAWDLRARHYACFREYLKSKIRKVDCSPSSDWENSLKLGITIMREYRVFLMFPR